MIFFIILFCLFIPTVYAQDYTITNYDVYITVLENNTYNISEVITTNFEVKKHGIYRTIPLKNEIYRTDGSKDTTYAKVKNVGVDAPFGVSKDNNIYTIKIGSANEYVYGKQTYMINYTYDLYRSERQKDYDEFYFNIIGDDWDTSIDKVNFTITMPKDFDETKMGFSKGYTGTINSDNIEYQVEGTTIKGSYNKTLKANEALTIRIPLEEGYFKKKFHIEDLAIYISIVCLILTILLWYFYGKDNKAIETVEFYPPDNLNSLELAYAYRGRVRNKDVTSLLIYLANKGYVKITEIEKPGMFNKTDYIISKIKEYDGNNELEKIFLNGLFKYKTTVSSSDLYDSFYVTTNRLKNKVTGKNNKNLIFGKASKKLANLILALIFLTYLVSFIIPLTINSQYILSIIPLFLLLFYTPFYKVMIETKNVFLSLFIIIHSSIFFSVIIGIIINEYSYLTLNFIGAIVCIILMLIFYSLMPKRTKYGTEILGKIKGFKNFLETVEKEQLEKLVNEKPTYFYDILPYTYVLDISDKWISKFESINLQAPEWYYGTNYEFNHFNDFISRTVNDTNSFAGSKSSSSSFSSSGGSSSSSGGGFSGGGSGGGGGGSW